VEMHFADGSVEQYNDTPLKAGAQGAIYLSRDQRSVVKLYHKDPSNPAQERENRDRIDKLIARFNPTRQDPYWTQFFTWPEKRVDRPGVGYRMRFVSGMRTLDHYIFLKAYSRLPPEEKGWFIGRIAVAIKMVTAADRMARMGLCYPDFSPKNIMVDPFAGHMVLIDCDSLTVPKLLPATIAGTSWYRAPEIITQKTTTPSVQSDRHALAVLLYHWFLLRHPLDGDRAPLDPDPDRDDLLHYGEKALYAEHPTDRTNQLTDPSLIRTSALGPELQKLFQLAFVDGLHQPYARPLPYQWQKGLQHTYDQIVPCASQYCDWRFFVFQPSARPVCPKCREPMKNPATLPLLYLHAQKSSTNSVQGSPAVRSDAHYIVGWPQRFLHKWHTHSDVTPFYTDPQNIPDNAPCAVFACNQKNQWYLQNLTLTEMRYRLAGDPANHWRSWPINGSVQLEPQMEVLFSSRATSFRAMVEMHRVG